MIPSVRTVSFSGSAMTMRGPEAGRATVVWCVGVGGEEREPGGGAAVVVVVAAASAAAAGQQVGCPRPAGGAPMSGSRSGLGSGAGAGLQLGLVGG